MSAITEEETTDAGTDPNGQLAAAGHRVLEMFVAICGAPDDKSVAAEGDRALAELTRLVRSA